MDVGFGEALLYSGALLALAAALSGLMRGTVLSISVLSVAAGLILAEAGAIHIEGSDQAVVNLFLLALIVTLFSDGLFVERELLILHWGPVVRALVIAMPITLVLLALAAKVLFSELSWAEAFLLGSVLSATDPVVTSAVVTSQRVPSAVRHALNLESGLNDGLALPFVLFFIILASPGGDAGTEAAKLVGEAAFGAVLGVLIGLGAGRLTHHLPGGGIVRRYEGIYALGVGLLTYGLADVTVGNGLIAAFVCGISLAVAKRDIADDFVVFSENVSSILQVLTFFAFGGLIVATGYHEDIPLLVVFIAFALGDRAPRRDHHLLLPSRAARAATRIHRLVRAKGGGGNPVRRAGPQLRCQRRQPDLRDGGVRDPRLDRRPRAHRHPGSAVDRGANLLS